MFLLVVVTGMLFTTESKAQSWQRVAFVSTDTINTSASKDTVDKVVTATAGYSTGAIKVEYTKVSGTVSLKAYIYSGDGTDYVLTDSSAAFSDASGVVYFTKSELPYSHYKVQIREAAGANSTNKVAIVVRYLLKRFDD